ncbi:RNA polymerase sigma-32 factor [Bradyrhizobium japonicum USDA 38]|nr:RNA polymerase sigma factor RpoH [Bradyrhizobium japonicum]MCS3897539.1 RNA polymerase sigma-32 factor [Bradyrhizobium japonicum USDA 38]MCS3950053.1 RNA polymerase sigma-32 factor [Bradyrhizobium japonicum]MCW2217353.1 RNA polymerase sigma-32 factor [Bradyrhizobium japonicum]MCW2341967.1 RNA polymerase sigma-32 factor [Bradyrhizobium japonicum]WLB51217.1 RNA polymerase sigma factor RpoH [Bradyrhizobium japonicum]
MAVAAGAPSAPFLSAYSAAIKRYELLEPGHEQQLARRWQETRDRGAVNALVTSHLRLAAKVARGYKGYGLPLADVIAEANLGLVIAASRFEPGRGARFSTYAVWWIKASVHEYILRSWSLVRIGTTAAQKKLFFKLRSEMRKAAGGAMAALTPDVAETIAERLDVTAREVIEMDSRLNGDMSLNARVGDDEQGTEWEALLVDQAIDAETVLADHEQTERRANALRAALGMLTARERHILEARRLAECPVTLEQLGFELSISSERVRQIEIRAFAKVRRAAILAVQDTARKRPDGVSGSRPREFTAP